MKFTCAFSCSPIPKTTYFLLVFAYTYVLLSLDFDGIDNTAIAKRTHVLSALAHTYALLSQYFDDIDNTCAF